MDVAYPSRLPTPLGLQCDVCNVAFQTTNEHREHRWGVRHNVNLSLSGARGHRCSLCDFACDELSDYTRHADSDGHKGRVLCWQGNALAQRRTPPPPTFNGLWPPPFPFNIPPPFYFSQARPAYALDNSVTASNLYRSFSNGPCGKPPRPLLPLPPANAPASAKRGKRARKAEQRKKSLVAGRHAAAAFKWRQLPAAPSRVVVAASDEVMVPGEQTYARPAAVERMPKSGSVSKKLLRLQRLTGSPSSRPSTSVRRAEADSTSHMAPVVVRTRDKRREWERRYRRRSEAARPVARQSSEGTAPQPAAVSSATAETAASTVDLVVQSVMSRIRAQQLETELGCLCATPEPAASPPLDDELVVVKQKQFGASHCIKTEAAVEALRAHSPAANDSLAAIGKEEEADEDVLEVVPPDRSSHLLDDGQDDHPESPDDSVKESEKEGRLSTLWEICQREESLSMQVRECEQQMSELQTRLAALSKLHGNLDARLSVTVELKRRLLNGESVPTTLPTSPTLTAHYLGSVPVPSDRPTP